MKRILLFIFLLACVGALPFACQNQSSETDRASTTAKTSAAEDQRITSAVRAKIDQDVKLNDAKIEVETSDAIVNLNGTIENDSDETEAIHLAQDVDGVRTVRSHLKASTDEGASGAGSSGTLQDTGEKLKEVADDAGITAQVKMKFAEDQEVSAMNIDVDTKDGVVTLKGNVKSRSEAQRAEKLARSVEGVQIVRSDLTVKATS